MKLRIALLERLMNSSMAKHLPSMTEAFSFIPRVMKIKYFLNEKIAK